MLVPIAFLIAILIAVVVLLVKDAGRFVNAAALGLLVVWLTLQILGR